MTNLKKLDLSLNNLTFSHLQKLLEQVLMTENSQALAQLDYLNLGKLHKNKKKRAALKLLCNAVKTSGMANCWYTLVLDLETVDFAIIRGF